MERAANAHATHVPVLVGLARLLNVERVIEYGCGEYSTLTFFNRSAFPRLSKLLSLENDAEWFARMAERAATIREVTARPADSTVVVIHDYEMAEYQQAVRGFTNRYGFDCLNPNTGVLWNNAPVAEPGPRSLNELIKRHAGDLQPEDVDGWVRALTAR